MIENLLDNKSLYVRPGHVYLQIPIEHNVYLCFSSYAIYVTAVCSRYKMLNVALFFSSLMHVYSKF